MHVKKLCRFAIKYQTRENPTQSTRTRHTILGRTRISWIGGAAIALLSVTVAADSSVWKVTNGADTLYIGGTIHVLTAEDYPLPSAFDEAYAQAEMVVLETDINRLNQAEFQAKMLTDLVYSGEDDLSGDISIETEQALVKFAASRGFPIELLMRFKPGMLSMSLTIMEMQRLGLAGAGVDAHFNKLAVTDDKSRGQLETAEQQLSFIAQMGNQQPDKFITFTLNQIEELPVLLSSMKASWRSGDLDAIDRLIGSEMKTEFPRIYDLLIVQRNNAWIPQIEEFIKTTEVEFVLVGVGHLSGPNGLLQQLTQRGYRIDQVRN
jgi:uncharacterized protein YbaP (TraB family)